jgi:hypothetical protein
VVLNSLCCEEIYFRNVWKEKKERTGRRNRKKKKKIYIMRMFFWRTSQDVRAHTIRKKFKGKANAI